MPPQNEAFSSGIVAFVFFTRFPCPAEAEHDETCPKFCLQTPSICLFYGYGIRLAGKKIAVQ